MRLLILYILYTLLLFVLPANAQDKPVNYQTIEELEEKWQVYDTDYKAYVPYLQGIHGSIEALHMAINPGNYKEYYLLIDTPRPVYLFVQAQLNRKLSENQKIVLDIDSLGKIYRQPELLFSFYSEIGHSKKPSVSIINYQKSQSNRTLQEASVLPMKPRGQSDLHNFAIIVALLILALFAFLWNYHPNAFKSYYNIKPAFSLSIKEDTVLISRPLSRISMLFIFNHSLLLAFLYILIQKSSEKALLNDRLLHSMTSFTDLFYYFFLLSLAVFILIVSKYFFLYFLGSLFNLSGVIYIHFYKYLLFSRLFYSVIVPVLFVIYLSFPTFVTIASQEIIYIIIAFNFIRFLIINFALNKLTSVKNLYLFSYLCATELTPILIGIKVLVA